MDFYLRLSQICNIPINAISATVKLLEDGNTIPFIARYRKEMTGSLDEEQLRTISENFKKLRNLNLRKNSILLSLEKQGFLTAELTNHINSANSLISLEEIYQPFKSKQRTRAEIAKSKGLTGLAELIIHQNTGYKNLSDVAKPYVSSFVKNTEDAFAGARDIVAERISHNLKVRNAIRKNILQIGRLVSNLRKNSKDPAQRFQIYYDFNSPLKNLRPHQILAINRGEKESILKVNIIIPEKYWVEPIQKHFPTSSNTLLEPQLTLAIYDCASRLLLPSIEVGIRKEITDNAFKHAASVFATNLRSLLLQAPIPDYVILAMDPGYRTGCKVAVVDPTGKVLETSTIYPHKPQEEWGQAKILLLGLIKKYSVNLIVIGNGTASRESEQLVVEIIKEHPLKYLITSEAGASVYSASKLAREELPGLDVTLRGAVSIARRVQDPLAELVKIDPQSIGVGLYQHDLNISNLKENLFNVVESVVNQVGVDVNTASPALLSYVAGIGPNLAHKIVAYRNANGEFRSKMDLMNIPGVGEKTFQQASGFLRVYNGTTLLDASSIHPESYTIAEEIAELAELDLSANNNSRASSLNDFIEKNPPGKLSEQLGIGTPTLTDILEQLVRPGRDIREDIPKPLLQSDIIKIEDLKENQILFGTVRNIVDFGAFIDIGVKIDGLLHCSKVPTGVNLRIGDIISIAITSVDIERQRISLKWLES